MRKNKILVELGQSIGFRYNISLLQKISWKFFKQIFLQYLKFTENHPNYQNL